MLEEGENKVEKRNVGDEGIASPHHKWTIQLSVNTITSQEEYRRCDTAITSKSLVPLTSRLFRLP